VVFVGVGEIAEAGKLPVEMQFHGADRAMTLLAEDLGFSFVLSPVKYRGFGGPTEQWDYVLESFEVMAALAEATDRIRLYGSVALPTVHPAITARRGATIDHIAQGRFGINLVSGWQKDEYAQMGLWPGDEHYQRRYQYAQEYVDILKLLWSQRDVDYDGEYFHLRDCRILPHPEQPLPLVCAGLSDVGMRFTAQHADYAFVAGDISGDAVFAANRKLQQYAEEAGRDVGAYTLYTLVLAETEAAAQAKSDYWMMHTDREALATMMGQAALDAAGGTAAALQAVAYIGITPIITSYAQCATILDDIGAVPGTKGSCSSSQSAWRGSRSLASGCCRSCARPSWHPRGRRGCGSSGRRVLANIHRNLRIPSHVLQGLKQLVYPPNDCL